MLFLVKRSKKDEEKVDILLVSSIDQETVAATMAALYPEYDIEIPEEPPEQVFNEQYGGIAILTTV